jgi:hypothetical protein
MFHDLDIVVITFVLHINKKGWYVTWLWSLKFIHCDVDHEYVANHGEANQAW